MKKKSSTQFIYPFLHGVFPPMLYIQWNVYCSVQAPSVHAISTADVCLCRMTMERETEHKKRRNVVAVLEMDETKRIPE